MLAASQPYPTPSLLHTASLQDHDREGGTGFGWAGPYIFIYVYI